VRALFLAVLLCATFIVPAWAQEEEAAGDALPPPPEPPVATREFEAAPMVQIRILDKVRAESRTYDLLVDRTVAYASLRIRPRSCRQSTPLSDPESAAFLQIWEIKPDQSSAWVFSGWMFASSPSLSAMDHPVYDVWVLGCHDPLKELASSMQEMTLEEEALFLDMIDAEIGSAPSNADLSEPSMNVTPTEDNAVESLAR
jgi:hypothetical protein